MLTVVDSYIENNLDELYQNYLRSQTGGAKATRSGLMADYNKSQKLGISKDDYAHMAGKEQFYKLLSTKADEIMNKCNIRSRHKSLDAIKANLN